MYSLLAATLLFWSADALLFPLNNGKEPEPELLARCPVPPTPRSSTMTCDYSLFRMKCTIRCNAGSHFENGVVSHSLECDLFEGYVGNLVVPACIATIQQPSSTTVPPVVVTGHCINVMEDCVNVTPQDYQLCNHCRLYATCAGSGFYIRQCPGISVYDSIKNRCVDKSETCTLKTK